MGTKHDVLIELFTICRKRENFVFDNALVKDVCKRIGFGNPFDVTKLDDTSKIPQALVDEDYFIIHLGGGKHQFAKGIRLGYHAFEIIEDNKIYEWKYRKSLLNELDTSESNILSVANNQRIIHDFLYEDIVASPKVYNERRTKISFKYYAGNEIIHAQNIQMEIDLTMEYNGIVTIFEGKNGTPENFAVYQLFHPYKYFSTLVRDNKIYVEQVTCCYILREKHKNESILKLYNYTFDDDNHLESIKLIKNAQYNLIHR